MRKKQGLTLMELLIAIGFFAITSVVLFTSVLTNAQVRKDNQITAKAQQYAVGILETYKATWSSKTPYIDQTTPANSLMKLLDGEYYASFKAPNIDLATCYRVDRTVVPCSGNPPIRQIKVTILDTQGVQRAELATEMGRPIQ